MGGHVITLNAGSSSIKFALFATEAGSARAIASGQIEGLGAGPKFEARAGEGAAESRALSPMTKRRDHAAALRLVLDWIERTFPQRQSRRDRPSRRAWRRRLFASRSCSTTTDPGGARRASRRSRRCTSRTISPASRRRRRRFPACRRWPASTPRSTAAIPSSTTPSRCRAQFYDEGIRRYGFHGLSYEYILAAAARDRAGRRGGPRDRRASRQWRLACARSHGGRSVASTMGFSALDGLPMGTRCGQLDPGVVLYLIEQKRHERRRRSPNCCTSTAGSRACPASRTTCACWKAPTNARRARAIDYFVFRVRREIGGAGGRDRRPGRPRVHRRHRRARLPGARADPRRAWNGSASSSTGPPTQAGANVISIAQLACARLCPRHRRGGDDRRAHDRTSPGSRAIPASPEPEKLRRRNADGAADV